MTMKSIKMTEIFCDDIIDDLIENIEMVAQDVEDLKHQIEVLHKMIRDLTNAATEEKS